MISTRVGPTSRSTIPTWSRAIRAGHGIAIARDRGEARNRQAPPRDPALSVTVSDALVEETESAEGAARDRGTDPGPGDLVTNDADAPIARDETEPAPRAGSGWSRSSTQDASRSSASGGIGLRWRFVDDPREGVSERRTRSSPSCSATWHRASTKPASKLEGNGQSGEDVSTEDLPVTLQRYRKVFERLLEA